MILQFSVRGLLGLITDVLLGHNLAVSNQGPVQGGPLRKRDSIFDYTADDVTIENYKHHPALKAPIAV